MFVERIWDHKCGGYLAMYENTENHLCGVGKGITRDEAMDMAKQHYNEFSGKID